MANSIQIKVIFAKSDNCQFEKEIDVIKGTNIQAAINHSGLLKKFPDIDFTKNKVGVFGEIKSLSDIVFAGDRIEIYQPICVDAKNIRRDKLKSK